MVDNAVSAIVPIAPGNTNYQPSFFFCEGGANKLLATPVRNRLTATDSDGLNPGKIALTDSFSMFAGTINTTPELSVILPDINWNRHHSKNIDPLRRSLLSYCVIIDDELNLKPLRAEINLKLSK